MVKLIIDLKSKFPPKFVNQRAYCAEINSWIVAVRSASGKGLVWLLPPINHQ